MPAFFHPAEPEWPDDPDGYTSAFCSEVTDLVALERWSASGDLLVMWGDMPSPVPVPEVDLLRRAVGDPRFDECLPVRHRFASARPFTGDVWLPESGVQVPFNTHAQLEAVTNLDGQRLFTGVAAEPFVLWVPVDGMWWWTIPHYVARLTDGALVAFDAYRVDEFTAVVPFRLSTAVHVFPQLGIPHAWLFEADFDGGSHLIHRPSDTPGSGTASDAA